MAERDVSLVDIPSMSDGLGEGSKITWDFSLPPTLDAERLVIKGGRLERIMSIAAFRSIHVNEYSGETSTHTPGIAGIDGQGNATAALNGQLQAADLHETCRLDDYMGVEGDKLMPIHGKTRVIAELNKPEIASKVVDAKREDGLTSEVAWAQQLNTALTQSLRHGAREHLINRDSNMSKYLGRANYAMLGGNTGLDILSQEASALFPALYVTICAAFTLIESNDARNLTGNRMLKERRWSLTPLSGEQWDRYLATQTLARTLPIIKVRE